MTAGPVLVTGGSGFVGPFLIAALEAAGREVVACGFPGEESGRSPLAPWPPRISPAWCQVDLTDREAVSTLVRDTAPAEVYHLAALSSVAASFADPVPTYQTNVMGTVHLLDAVRRHRPDARVLTISSAEVYGGGTPRPDERAPFGPTNPYAASKAAAEMVALQHHRAHGLAVVRARAFNHTGPGQSARFVVGAFARQIARIELGRQEPVLGVGNLDARRDFLDVRDVVEAYRCLMALGVPGEAYNVCSGQPVTMQALLDGLLTQAKVGIRVERDPELTRPTDASELVGDPTAIRATTGWRPQIPLEDTLRDVLTYWRAHEPYVGDVDSGLC